MTNQPLPFGIKDLDPNVVNEDGPPKRLRCFVNGCNEFLRPPARRFPGDVCPTHGIRSHTSGTYSYQDAGCNVIIDSDLFSQNVVGHPDKYESNRLGNEKSEDTLSWNVFRTFQRVGCLSKIAAEVFGIPETGEPTLYLWGLRVSDDSFEQWDLLRNARVRFESNLPVDRPQTEPDIAIHLPGRYLVLIEAKFTSCNPYYEAGERQDDWSLTLNELRDIYHDPLLRLLDFAKAGTRTRIHYQLWRNTVFAEWMAQQDSRTTKAYHVNLVRDGFDEDSAAEFHELIADDSKDRFRRVSWERIYNLARQEGSQFERLCEYLETKTANLEKAFRV